MRTDSDMIAMHAAALSVSADDEAMARVAAGDGWALASLFDRHKERLFGFLYHLVGDRALAEDLLGETFLRLYQARRRYRQGGGFEPWLYAIARNLALGELRRRSAFWRLRDELARRTAEVEQPWRADAGDAEQRVRAALSSLPEEQRAAVVLKEYLGLDYREVGLVLGCSEQAARARTYRAREGLRRSLGEWFNDSEGCGS